LLSTREAWRREEENSCVEGGGVRYCGWFETCKWRRIRATGKGKGKERGQVYGDREAYGDGVLKNLNCVVDWAVHFAVPGAA